MYILVYTGGSNIPKKTESAIFSASGTGPFEPDIFRSVLNGGVHKPGGTYGWRTGLAGKGFRISGSG